MKFIFFTKLSPQNVIKRQKEIADGSEPGGRFYAMVAISSVLASFGLVMDSTAVVIGAMLVAPLMTPVFGMALALLRSDAALLGRAIRAEIVGVVFAIFMAALLGYMIPELEATDQMLRRTTPNLLDLCVAVFAGLAGAYAMVDEKISPALPGVAIATSIVPPLANSGLCIALGAYKGAMGSFLLFFANFLSILIVSAFIFFFSGLIKAVEPLKKIDLLKRFGLAVIGFFLVMTFLSLELYKMLQIREVRDKIHGVLNVSFEQIASTALRKVAFQNIEDRLIVLARIESPKTIRTSKVKEIEERLSKELKRPVELIVRRTDTEEISSTGTVQTMIVETLDGFRHDLAQNPNIRITKLAEQTFRDFLADHLGIELLKIDFISDKHGPTILATITGLRKLSLDEIQNLEKQIQKKVDIVALHLVLQQIPAELYDRWGYFRYEWDDLETLNPQKKILLDRIFQISLKELKPKGYQITGLSLKTLDGMAHILLEISGAKSYSQKELITLQSHIRESLKDRVMLYVRFTPDVLVSEKGYSSFESVIEKFRKKTEKEDKEKIKKLIENIM